MPTPPDLIMGFSFLKGESKMNEIQVFEKEGFGQIRITDNNGEPWFVAKDIATILDYRTSNDMTRILDEDEKDTQIMSTLGGNQEMTIINESGLYSAIFEKL